LKAVEPSSLFSAVFFLDSSGPVKFMISKMPIIKLQSSDGEIFPVDVDIARQSVTIKTMLDDLGMDEDEEEVVPLPNVNAGILKKVQLTFKSFLEVSSIKRIAATSFWLTAATAYELAAGKCTFPWGYICILSYAGLI
jgi:hypothetical protein